MKSATTQFVYCLKEIELRYNELKQAIPNRKIYYSIKPNPNATILEFIAQLGLEAEVSSAGELDAALDAGFTPSLIVYGGPGKTVKDILYAAEKGVISFSLESITELERLAIVEGLVQKKLNRILRIFIPNNNGRLNMMMPNSKFGITLEELKMYVTKNNDVIYGIHIFNGTQINEVNFRKSIYETNYVLFEIEPIIGYKLKYVNYGGGLEWPFMQSGTAIISQNEVMGILSDIDSCFEFGRYLVASCGTLETEVLDVKERNGLQILIVSAGVNILNGISSSGRLIRQKPHFYVATNENNDEILPTAVYGPLCTPADYLTLETLLPRLSPGDILAIPNCGAYAANTGLNNFLLREPAIEVIIE